MRTLLLTLLLLAAPAYAKKGKKPAPEPVPTEAPAPVPTEPAPTVAAPTEPVYGPIDRPPLHVPPADLAALLPADHAGLTELQALYTDFCDDVLGDDEAANTTLLTVTKPQELDALTTKGMEIVRAGGHDTPAAAVFVLANARLAYADLAYSMKPTTRMNEQQVAAFWKVLNVEVWPTMVPVDVEAKVYLDSIVKGAREGSPWRTHAEALLAKMHESGRGEAVVAPAVAPTSEPAPVPAPAPAPTP